MKTIYEAIASWLIAIDGISWVDLDNGQLDYYEYRAPVLFPACLIGIDYPACDDIGLTGAQQCQVNITIRLVAQVFDETNIAAPNDIRNRALAIFDLMDKIQEKLQWWKPDAFSSRLSRKSVTKDKRDDGLMVLNITYSSTIVDARHDEPARDAALVDVVVIR